MKDPLIKSNLTQAEYFKDIVATIREPLLVLDARLRVLAANRSFYTTFKVKQKDTLGNQIYDLGNRQWDIPALRTLLESILPEKAVFNDYEVEHDFPIIGKRSLLLNARRIPTPPKEARWILLAFEDITERRRLERILQASEKRFRLAFETATDNMLLVDKTSGRVLNSNRAAKQTFGYSNQKLLKRNLWELDILKDQQQFEQVSEQLEKEGAIQILDKTVHTRGGGQFPASIYLMDRTGVIQCNIRDISARKLAEEKLRGSENELRSLFAAMTDVVIVLDEDGRYLKIAPTNPANLYRLPEDLIGKTIHEVLPKEKADFMIAKISEAIQTNQVVFGEYSLKIDGKDIWFASNITKLSENSVIWVAHDITEHKYAEEALRESEEKFRILIENSVAGIYIIQDTKMAYVNPSFAKAFGYSPEEINGRFSPKDLIHPEDIQAVMKRLQERQEGETEKSSIAYRGIKKDGSIIYIEIHGMAINYQGRPAIIGTLMDITERKRAEAQLVEHHATLNVILESSATPVFSIDNQYRYTSFNKAHAAVMKILYGAEIELGHSMLDYQIVPEDREISQKNIDRALFGQQFIQAAYSGEPGPTRRYFEVAHNPIFDPTGKAIGVSVFASDITERRQAEETLQTYSSRLAADVIERTRELQEAQEQLVRKEKLAVLGALAGGVGHELRNPLGVIGNSVYYLKMVQPEANEKIKKHLALIEQEVHNAARIVSDLLDYARDISTCPKPGSVRDLVEHTLSRFPVPASIQVSLKIPAALPQVYADPLHVEQVLGNLIANACQAIKGDGKLTILARLKKKMVAISVKDTGTGITSENMQKLFEPLFSTKVTGIGLGLAVSKKLAEANGSRIEVESKVGKGSTFTLYLPAIGSELGS